MVSAERDAAADRKEALMFGLTGVAVGWSREPSPAEKIGQAAGDGKGDSNYAVTKVGVPQLPLEAR